MGLHKGPRGGPHCGPVSLLGEGMVRLWPQADGGNTEDQLGWGTHSAPLPRSRTDHCPPTPAHPQTHTSQPCQIMDGAYSDLLGYAGNMTGGFPTWICRHLCRVRDGVVALHPMLCF